MEKQEITIYDVAREADVSMATVSRVVNGNKNVREETRKKVQAVIDRLNYQPNAVARGLASKRTTTIGLIVPDLNNLYFSELAKGIDDIATLYKYNIIITSVDNVNREEEVIQNLLRKQVDGVIYLSNELSQSAKDTFIRTKTPVVLAGTIDQHSAMPSVNIDFKQAVKDSVKLLAEHGKKNIGLVLGNGDADLNQIIRIPAFKEALADSGLNFVPENIFVNNYSYDDSYNGFDKIKNANIDGVITSRDLSAAGIINAAREAGTDIPEDLEVITTQNTVITKITRPSITSIKQPLYDIGAVSMRILTKMITNEDLDETEIILPFSIVERNSTK